MVDDLHVPADVLDGDLFSAIVEYQIGVDIPATKRFLTNARTPCALGWIDGYDRPFGRKRKIVGCWEQKRKLWAHALVIVHRFVPVRSGALAATNVGPVV